MPGPERPSAKAPHASLPWALCFCCGGSRCCPCSQVLHRRRPLGPGTRRSLRSNRTDYAVSVLYRTSLRKPWLLSAAVQRLQRYETQMDLESGLARLRILLGLEGQKRFRPFRDAAPDGPRRTRRPKTAPSGGLQRLRLRRRLRGRRRSDGHRGPRSAVRAALSFFR